MDISRKIKNVAGMAALALLASCSADENAGDYPMPENYSIDFSTSVSGKATKGILLGQDNFLSSVTGFLVWGNYSSDGEYFVGKSATEGVEIAKNGDAWTYKDEAEKAMWPPTAKPLNFQAVTPVPAADSWFTVTNTVSNNLPHVVADVTVPATVTDQKDIMFAQAKNQTSETNARKVALAFEHGMSAVRFKAKNAVDNMVVNIQSISLCQINAKGKVGFVNDNALGSSIDASPVYRDYSPGLSSSAGNITSTTAADITADDGTLIMLPQTTTKWASGTTVEAAKTAHQSYISINCKISHRGFYLVGSESAYGNIYIPFAADWAVGKKYTYTLSFGTGKGVYDENGKELMAGVEFSTDVEGWTEENVMIPSPYNGHDYVDLGLPSGLKWATCNIGADSPEKAGLYFAWGETVGYTADQVKGGVRSFSSSVYNSGPAASISSNLTIDQDAVNAYMGGEWRMPTLTEFDELKNSSYTTTTWTTDYNGTGVAGHIITSKSNGNSIFLPAAGNCNGSSVYGVGSYGYYWSSTCYSSSGAYDLDFNSGGVYTNGIYRYYGCSVRGVCE